MNERERIMRIATLESELRGPFWIAEPVLSQHIAWLSHRISQLRAGHDDPNDLPENRLIVSSNTSVVGLSEGETK